MNGIIVSVCVAVNLVIMFTILSGGEIEACVGYLLMGLLCALAVTRLIHLLSIKTH